MAIQEFKWPNLTGLVNFFSGFMTGATWSTTSTTFADPTVAGTNALTARPLSTLTVTAAASNLPGITFTPASASSVYLIIASFQGYNSTAADNSSWQLTDGTSQIGTGGLQQGVTSTGTEQVIVHGLYAPGSTSPVTVKLQGAASAGTTNWGFVSSGSKAIEWNVIQIA